MELVTYRDSDTMMDGLATTLATALTQALAQHDTVSFAVPGGTTPAPVFERLCHMPLDWARVHVMLTDERWVPDTSGRSNTRLLQQHLLKGAAAAAGFVPLYNGAPTPEDGLPDLQDNLARHLPVDVMLLGMGADMHTASIFPGADRLAHALDGEDLLVAMRAPGAPEPRITLSAKVLKAAARRHIVITGPEKRAALEAARSLPPHEAPVAAVLAGSTVHWAEG